MVKKDKSVIPLGVYCYTIKNGKQINCPYWSMQKDKPYQFNGYCGYLEKGDWELYLEDEFTIIYPKKGIVEHKKGKELIEEDGAPLSLLWDQCKECDVNDGFDDMD